MVNLHGRKACENMLILATCLTNTYYKIISHTVSLLTGVSRENQVLPCSGLCAPYRYLSLARLSEHLCVPNFSLVPRDSTNALDCFNAV